jgi:hypothetical protein
MPGSSGDVKWEFKTGEQTSPAHSFLLQDFGNQLSYSLREN